MPALVATNFSIRTDLWGLPRRSDRVILRTVPHPQPPSLESLEEVEAEHIDNLMQAARPPAADNVVLAEARVAGRLFDQEEGGLGRFRVLDRLGRGGMGVVYAAYDPQLDRSVALKTVHVPTRGRELALQEAKTLAKLSHPNIVPVFDVGIADDQIYIVMELVRGQTLREWAIGKTQRTILEAYRQAGLALAAAHDARLVHRDFKPDNAIVGNDGRVRVVDFGLACETTDPERSGSALAHNAAGTPKYMAPEQRSSGPITAAADQYSFGVSLAEAVGTPLPSWVEAVVRRACSEQPSQRFSSMRDLLRELSRDPARRRQRRIGYAALTAAVAGVSASAAIFASSTGEVEPCGGGARELQTTWPSVAQHAVATHIAGLSPYGRSMADVLSHQFSTYRTRWAAEHRDACLAQRGGELSSRLFDRRVTCLDHSRAAFAAVAQIAAQTTADDLPNLARAAAAIPNPDACRNSSAVASKIEPPPPWSASEVARQRSELAKARIRLAAANYDEARTIADQAIARARALHYRPLLAEALLVQGRTWLQSHDRSEGVTAFREAARVALEVHADDLAVEAWARRAWIEGTTEARNPAALGGLELVTALASRSPTAFPRALLYNNLGSVELGRGNRAAAASAFERALAEAKAVPDPIPVELIQIRQNLALTMSDDRQADKLLLETRSELAAQLGEVHPDVLMVDYLRATVVTASLPKVASILTELCAKDELHPGLSSRTAECWVELADVRYELGDQEGAVRSLVLKKTVNITKMATEQRLARCLIALPPELQQRQVICRRGFSTLKRLRTVARIVLHATHRRSVRLHTVQPSSGVGRSVATAHCHQPCAP